MRMARVLLAAVAMCSIVSAIGCEKTVCGERDEWERLEEPVSGRCFVRLWKKRWTIRRGKDICPDDNIIMDWKEVPCPKAESTR